MYSAKLWPTSSRPLSIAEETERLDFLQPLFGGELAKWRCNALFMHYERLTKHQRQTLPISADLVFELDRQPLVTSVKLRDVTI